MTVFLIDNLCRAATAEVLGTPPRGMLIEAPVKISCDAGVECVVRAEDYIDLPLHFFTSIREYSKRRRLAVSISARSAVIRRSMRTW